MQPKWIIQQDKSIRLEIPVKDIEKAKLAMKDHKKMLGFIAGPNAETEFLKESGTEAEVNAKYQNMVSPLMGCNYGGSRYFNRTYTISENSEYKTVYLMESGRQKKQNTMKFELGKIKNEMGKDLLVIHSTLTKQMPVRAPTAYWFVVLLMAGLCCFATCVKSWHDDQLSRPVREVMQHIQEYVDTYEVTGEAKDI